MHTLYRILYRHENLSGIIWFTATAQSWSKSFTRIDDRDGLSGWPRGLGELKRKPHLWIFVSVSVGSRPRCKSLTSATFWIPVPTEKKSGRNLDKIRTAQLQSFIEIATNSSFWWVTRSLIVPLISLISTVVLVNIIKQTLFTLVSWYSQHCMVYLRHLSFPHLCATM